MISDIPPVYRNQRIEIRKMPDGNPMIISYVSDFCDSMGFCEFKIKNLLKGIKPPQTNVMIEGTKSHKKEAEYEKDHFRFVILSQQELANTYKDVEFPRENIYTRYLAKIKYDDKNLQMLIIGRADKIMRSKGTLIIEESKYPERKEKYLEKFEPYEDQKLQALLYLNSHFSEDGSLFAEDGSLNSESWFDIPHKNKVWIVNIKDRKTRKNVKTFEGLQTNEAEDFLKEKLNRFALVILGQLEPEHHRSIKKCLSCRFLDGCEYKIAGS